MLDHSTIREAVREGLALADKPLERPVDRSFLRLAEHMRAMSSPEADDPTEAIRADALAVLHEFTCTNDDCDAVPEGKCALIHAIRLAPDPSTRYRFLMGFPWLVMLVTTCQRGDRNLVAAVADGLMPPSALGAFWWKGPEDIL